MIETLLNLVWVSLLLAAGWVIWQNSGLRERAVALVRQHCESADVQLLDETVSLVSIRPKRHPRGYMALQRRYEFEFTVTGDRRYYGHLTLIGQQPVTVQLQPHRLH